MKKMNKLWHKLSTLALCVLLSTSLLPQVTLAAGDFSGSAIALKTFGPGGAGKGTGNPTASTTSAENTDQIFVLATITNSGTSTTPSMTLDLSSTGGAISYVNNSLEYYNSGGGSWDAVDDTNFLTTSSAFPSAINNGASGFVRFYLQLDTAGTATYLPQFKISSDGPLTTKTMTIKSPMARLTSANDDDQEVIVTFGAAMSDTGLTTVGNYLLSTDGNPTYSETPTGVTKDSSTQVTLTFAGSTFSGGNTLQLRTSGLTTSQSVQLENTATDGRYETNTFTAVDTTPPTVTITQNTGQTDPTASSPIEFLATFSETVTGFTSGDVTTGGTAGGPLSVSISAGGSANKKIISVTGMSSAGTVTVSIGAGTFADAAANTNTATSTNTDNSVTYTSAPTVTVEQAGSQDDPTNNATINFTATFSRAVNGFATGDVTVGGTANPTTGTVTEIAPNDGTTFNIAVTGMTNNGTVTASLGAAVATAQDDATNNLASTSTDNEVTYDTTGPTISSVQNITNTDSATSTFDVTFDQALNLSTFTHTDITLSRDGSADLTTAAQTITLSSGTTYRISGLSSITETSGTYTLTIDATGITDTAGNAGTGTDSDSWVVSKPGTCGTANGSSTSIAPSSNLCGTNSTASSVSTSGSSWIWTCTRDTAASCSATISSSGGGGGGGGSSITSTPYRLSSSFSDNEKSLEDRPLKLSSNGDVAGTFTSPVTLIGTSSKGNLTAYFEKETVATDTDGKPYTDEIEYPKRTARGNLPAYNGLTATIAFRIGSDDEHIYFSKPVLITLNFEDDEDLTGYQVFWLKDDNTYELIDNGGTVTDQTLSFYTDHFSKFVIFDTDGSTSSDDDNHTITVAGFTDIGNHWAKTYIANLSDRDVISGKSNGLFDPDANITRAELTKIALLNFDYTTEDSTPDFSDITDVDWYRPYVAAAAQIGFIQGYSDGTFRPNISVNRAEALKMLLAAKDIDTTAYNLDTDTFYDVDSDAWYAPYLAYAYENSIISGYSETVGGTIAENYPELATIIGDESGEHVRALQGALLELGYTIEITGEYDTQTKQVLAQYQLAEGLITSLTDSNAGWFVQSTYEYMLTQTVSSGNETQTVLLFKPAQAITRAEVAKIADILAEAE